MVWSSWLTRLPPKTNVPHYVQSEKYLGKNNLFWKICQILNDDCHDYNDQTASIATEADFGSDMTRYFFLHCLGDSWIDFFIKNKWFYENGKTCQNTSWRKHMPFAKWTLMSCHDLWCLALLDVITLQIFLRKQRQRRSISRKLVHGKRKVVWEMMIVLEVGFFWKSSHGKSNF